MTTDFYPYTEQEHIDHCSGVAGDPAVVMMTDCERCWDDIHAALGEEATRKLANAVPDLLEKVNAHLVRDDVQTFERIRSLGGENAKVWHRLFSGDFMAETLVLKEGARRKHRLTATGDTVDETLANLATAVADYLY